jgi:hypothetical protein
LKKNAPRWRSTTTETRSMAKVLVVVLGTGAARAAMLARTLREAEPAMLLEPVLTRLDRMPPVAQAMLATAQEAEQAEPVTQAQEVATALAMAQERAKVRARAQMQKANRVQFSSPKRRLMPRRG